MSRRAAAAVLAATALALAGCGGLPRVPSIDMAGIGFPRFGAFGHEAGAPAGPANPYKLSEREVAAVKSGMSAAFTDGRSLSFGPIEARLRTDGSLLICGFARIRRPDGRESGMRLFDGRAEFDPFGVLRFQPARLAGSNGKFLDIYTDCRSAGALRRT